MSQTTSKGASLKSIISFLKKFAPKNVAEEWDNTGLLIEPMTPKPVETILLTNDLSEDVVLEAVDLNVGLIISYHPPIFKPLKKVTTDSWKERVIATCLENKIAVYSPHTSWDNITGGVNDWLVSAFDVELIQPIKNLKIGTGCFGAGRFCCLKTSIKISDAVEKVKELTGVKYLNLALAKNATLDTTITNVAICAGSGASVLQDVKSDLYVTGEMSHHSLLDAIHNGTSVILCNHSNSERGFLKEFQLKLENEFGSDVTVYVSQKDKDPLEIV